jgi:hypothetical protein
VADAEQGMPGDYKMRSNRGLRREEEQGVEEGGAAGMAVEGAAGMEELSLSDGGGSQTLADVARASFYGCVTTQLGSRRREIEREELLPSAKNHAPAGQLARCASPQRRFSSASHA